MLKMGKFTKLFSNQPHEGKERIEGGPLRTFRGCDRWLNRKNDESAKQQTILPILTPIGVVPQRATPSPLGHALFEYFQGVAKKGVCSR